MVKQPEINIDLNQLNHSELVLLCQWMGISANRGIPREYLVRMLENFVSSGMKNPLDEKREIISQFLQKYWDRIGMQSQKKVCPDCFQCRDMQVLYCYHLNKKSLRG